MIYPVSDTWTTCTLVGMYVIWLANRERWKCDWSKLCSMSSSCNFVCLFFCCVNGPFRYALNKITKRMSGLGRLVMGVPGVTPATVLFCCLFHRHLYMHACLCACTHTHTSHANILSWVCAHTCTHTHTLHAHSLTLVHHCMVYTELGWRWQQFHMAPAM